MEKLLPESKNESEPNRPANFNELVGHLKLLKRTIGDKGAFAPLQNFRFLAQGESEEGNKFLEGKPQFNGWRPEHFRLLVEEFEKQ